MSVWPDDELRARADRIIELETELEAMTTAATMYREVGDALRQRLEGAVEALDEAIKAARLFNRSGMTWLEYDRLLVRLEGVVNQAWGQ